MSEEPIKTCPDCGGEYAPHGQVCADCGKALVLLDPNAPPPAPLTEGEVGVCVREDRIHYLHELQALLDRKGIRSAIRLHREIPHAGAAGSLYGLYVLQADEQTAGDIDRAHWLKGAPEDAAAFQYTEQELAGRCPMCDTELPKGAGECAECGLAVGAVEVDTCPACDADVPADAEKCPNCGVEFE